MGTHASLGVCAAVVALVGCAPQPSPPRSAPSNVQARATAAGPDHTAVTGATLHDFIERLPAPDRRPLAYRLIREGNLVCTRRTEVMCTAMIAEPEDSETMSDPCLRRAMVIGLLGAEPGAVPDDVLRALPTIGDDEMTQAFANVIPPTQRLELAAMLEALGKDATSIVMSVSAEEAADAVSRRHLEAAIDHVDARRAPDVLFAVIGDETYSPRAKIDAIFALRQVVPDPMAGRSAAGERLAAALVPLIDHDDCRLAARVAEARWELVDDHRALPVNPRTRDRARMMRALCILAEYQGYNVDEIVATYLPAKGVEVVYPRGLERSDSSASTRARYVPGDFELRRILELLAGAKCMDTSCDVEIARVDLVFEPRPNRELQLTRIVYRRDAAAEARIDECTPEAGSD